MSERDYQNQTPEALAQLHAFAALAKTGIKVYHQTKAYELKVWKDGSVNIVCTLNEYAIGLFHHNDTGANAFPDELFVEPAA